MQFLILGGTGLTGPYIVRELIEQGHQVAVFHRGQTQVPLPSHVTHILGDRRHLHEFVGEFKQLAPQVVIDMLAFTREDAQLLMRVFTGLADRVVVASSCDVYRAFGRLHRTEPGHPDPVPLTEDAPLREKLSPHGEAYEKRWVEDAVLSEAKLPGTVLRYPAVHGPGDYRPYEYLKRMEDGRPFILLGQETAAWQFSHGYAENVAHALVLAATNEQAAHRIYNVADTTPAKELDWVQLIGKAAGWQGRVIVIPQNDLPEHMQEKADLTQYLTVDTTRLRNELGYQEKIDPLEGMKRTVDWIRAHPPKQIDLTSFDYPAEDSTFRKASQDMIGLKHNQNLLVDYDPAWPLLFDAEKDRLQHVLMNIPLGIEHYGSTAVPGLPAKPIIDILVGVLPLSDWVRCKEPLESLGYDYAEHAGVLGHYIFGRGRDRSERTHLVHIVEFNGPSWRFNLAFRDKLRANQSLREEYLIVKQAAVNLAPEGRGKYNQLKQAFFDKEKSG